MINFTFFTRLMTLFLVAFLSACVTTQPYDYTEFYQAKPRSILVMPPVNNSIEVDAPYIYLSTITRPLAEKGYYVFPVFLVDTFFKENGLHTTEEMNTVSLDKIDEHFGADAVLYVTIENWGQKYYILQSTTIVQASLTLVAVKSGATIWQASAAASRSSDDGGAGLIGALVSAAITQVLATTVADQTFHLSSQANNNAIHNPCRGLLDGPYVPVENLEAP